MKRRRSRGVSHQSAEPIAWLPIDSRLFPFIGFSHVKGLARIFLIIEMSLSAFMVVASFVLVLYHVMVK